MITKKTKEEIDILREGGKHLASVLEQVRLAVKPGVTAKALDTLAEKLIREYGDTPAFLNYKPDGASYAYPATLCVSVNSEVVHGIPTASKVLKEGDIVSIDLGLKHKGMYVDHALTVPVGEISKKAADLLKATREALSCGIDAAQPGKRVGDIGYAIEQFIKPRGYGIVRELAGHGVGYEVHEDPYVPNYGKKGTGVKLEVGMVIAIEPMINEGSPAVFIADDEWTYRTRDGKRSAHFEHTVVITEDGPEILTSL